MTYPQIPTNSPGKTRRGQPAEIGGILCHVSARWHVTAFWLLHGAVNRKTDFTEIFELAVAKPIFVFEGLLVH